MMCKDIEKVGKIPKAQSTPQEMFAHFKPDNEESSSPAEKIQPLKHSR